MAVTTAAASEAQGPLAPYDGFLLLSFGGPEGPEEVLPFLQNVTRDRGAPQARLEAVASHYDHMEIVNDLDTDAVATARRLGLGVVRTPTPGSDPRFVEMICDLMEQRAVPKREEPGRDHGCQPGCCPSPGRGPA